MLTATDRALIATSLDGPLAVEDQDRVRLLLNRSRDARRLQQSLVRERSLLANLPTHPAPPSVLPAVMARIAETDCWATIPRAVRNTTPRRLLPTAIAASVMLLAGSGLWYGLHINQRHALGVQQAQSLPKVEEATAQALDVSPEVVSRIPAIEYPATVAQVTEIAPVPRAAVEKTRDVYGAPFVAPPKLDSVLVKLPMIAATKDLARDDVKKQLTGELTKAPLVRVDLFSRDPLKAAELLVATGRAAGVNVILDAMAQERLRRRLPTTWLIYTESLTPDEASGWLQRLAAADVKVGEGSGPASVFQSLHIPALTTQDSKDLKDLLSIEASKPKAVKASPAKPVSAGTLDEISSSLQKDKNAILVSFLPQSARANPAQSKDVKAWIDRRGDRKSGTVALLIVVR